MKLKDVTIVDFNFSAGLKEPIVRAMVQFTFDELDEPQIIWIDLTPAEVQTIVSVARAIEQRFLIGETPIPTEAERHLGFRTPGHSQDLKEKSRSTEVPTARNTIVPQEILEGIASETLLDDTEEAARVIREDLARMIAELKRDMPELFDSKI